MNYHELNTSTANASHRFAPPGPKPVEKNYLDYGLKDNIKALYGMATNPMTTLSAYQFELPVFQYQIFGNHFTVINDPDMIRHCFVENAANYTLEPIRQAILTPVLRQGLVAVEGEVWKRARRVLAPIFTPRHTRAYALTMQSAVKSRLSQIMTPHHTVPLADLMSDLAYQVLSATLFSGEIDEQAEAMMSDVASFFQHMGNVDPFDLMDLPHWLPRLTRLRGRGAVKRLRARISALTQDRLARHARGKSLPDDFLSRLILAHDKTLDPPTPNEIEDHILTFIAAGHETTARGLAWLIYLLTHSPNDMAKVVAEIDALDIKATAPADWQNHLPWLTACFDEAMRLFPPAPFITRMARDDDQYKLAFIPKNGNVLLNLYALHRHHTLWEQPDIFSPQRFTEPQNAARHKFQYLPFGVGHRTCIGGHFAVMEAMIILVLMLKSYRFDYVGTTPPMPVMRITLKPDNGIPVRISPR